MRFCPIFSAFVVIPLMAGSAAFAAKNCPDVVQDPTKLKCTTIMDYSGQKFAKDLIVPLATDADGAITGSVDFQYPNVANDDGTPNTLKAKVFTETHGNSKTCQVQQTFELELSVLSYKIAGAGRKTSVRIDDGFGFNTFELDMTCVALK